MNLCVLCYVSHRSHLSFFRGVEVFSYIVSHYLYLCVECLCHIVLICHFCVELKFMTHARRMLVSYLHLILRGVEVYHTRTKNAISKHHCVIICIAVRVRIVGKCGIVCLHRRCSQW